MKSAAPRIVALAAIILSPLNAASRPGPGRAFA
jgi:hypothetical protein